MMSAAFGFRIIRPLELHEWKPFPLGNGIPFAAALCCPAHQDTPLKILAALISADGAMRVRIGCCPACGYMGYMDRPTREWIAQFYLSGMWDSGSAKKDRRIAALKKGGQRVGTMNDSVRLISRLQIDQRRPVLEIGCGYGESLAHLRGLGFTRLVGLESSPHRAAITHEALGIAVVTGPFEDAPMDALCPSAPFGLIIAHHVLEHVYDPGVFLARVALLQEMDDVLVVSVPNAHREPTMAVLTYFPHLHAFTYPALARLLARHGYAVTARSADERVITVAAKRVIYPAAPSYGENHPYDAMREKIIRGIGLGKTYPFAPRRLWWARKSDVGGQRRFFPSPALERLHHAAAGRLRRFADPSVFSHGTQSLLVEDAASQPAAAGASPIVIHFTGPVTLFYK